jgi:hypothetical protein
MLRGVGFGLIAVLAVGAPAVSAQEASSLPPPSNAEAMQAGLKAAFENRLKDPESARYEFSEPVRAYCRQGFMGKKPPRYGWAMNFTVNAKNSYGGYTGPQPYTALDYDDSDEMPVWPGFNFGLSKHACLIERPAN